MSWHRVRSCRARFIQAGTRRGIPAPPVKALARCRNARRSTRQPVEAAPSLPSSHQWCRAGESTDGLAAPALATSVITATGSPNPKAAATSSVITVPFWRPDAQTATVLLTTVGATRGGRVLRGLGAAAVEPQSALPEPVRPTKSDSDVTFGSWPVSHGESKSPQEASWPAVHGSPRQN